MRHGDITTASVEGNPFYPRTLVSSGVEYGVGADQTSTIECGASGAGALAASCTTITSMVAGGACGGGDGGGGEGGNGSDGGEKGGTATYPYLVERTAGVSMFESADIVAHLVEKYGRGAELPCTRPWRRHRLWRARRRGPRRRAP